MLSFMKIVILATLQSLALSFNIPLDARQINSIIESSEQGTTVSNNVQVTFEGRFSNFVTAGETVVATASRPPTPSEATPTVVNQIPPRPTRSLDYHHRPTKSFHHHHRPTKSHHHHLPTGSFHHHHPTGIHHHYHPVGNLHPPSALPQAIASLLSVIHKRPHHPHSEIRPPQQKSTASPATPWATALA